jgi:hypothetical protein
MMALMVDSQTRHDLYYSCLLLTKTNRMINHSRSVLFVDMKCNIYIGNLFPDR